MSQIFLSYTRTDEKKVTILYNKLQSAGFNPWMDKQCILPGEDWKYKIQQAIKNSDFFCCFLSRRAVKKRGFFQTEIKEALDLWREQLISDIYFIPAKLEECKLSYPLSNFQWVNLYEPKGWETLLLALSEGLKRRRVDPNIINYYDTDRNSNSNDIVGIWHQYVERKPENDIRLLAIFKVWKVKEKYYMGVDDRPEGNSEIESLGLLSVTFDGFEWTFKSDWGKYGIALFKLHRVSSDRYEGFSYVNEKQRAKNIWLRKIQ